MEKLEQPVSRSRDATFETEVAEKIAPIARSVLDAVVAVDGEGAIVAWNERAAQMLGWTREEAVGRNMGALIVPRQFREAHEEGLRRYQRTGEARVLNRRIEMAAVDKAGREFPVELAIVDMAVSGRPVFLGFLRDISERRDAEARLARSEDELRRQAQEFHALADNIPTLCWMAYADGHIYWYNRRWYEYTGATADSQEGWGWESVHHPDHLPKVVERWRRSLETGEPFEMTFPLLGADGSFRPFLTRIVPIRDEAGAITRWFGANIDVTDQERQQEHLQLMINELNHRVKNTLATVQSIASRSLRNAATVKEGLDAFEGRLMALSATHDVLTETHWEGADLQVLLDRALKPFAGGEAPRLVAQGGAVWMPQRAAISLSMVMHELATNAVKYGALAAEGGSVAVRWSVAGAPERLDLEWVERGGPAVQPPTRVGFGSRLIERTIRSELGGSVELLYAPPGLTCRLSFPLAKPGDTRLAWRQKKSGDRLNIAPSG